MLKAIVLLGVAKAKAAVQDLAISATLVTRGPVVQVPGSAPTYPTIASTSIKIVISGYKSTEVDGDRIRASDRAGLIFPEDGQPTAEPNDQVVIGSYTYRVVYNNKVMAGDTVALSQVQLRLA